MAKIERIIKKKDLKHRGNKTISGPLNDGMNTPVPDQSTVSIPSETETALLKQAENPLGNPDKV